LPPAAPISADERPASRLASRSRRGTIVEGTKLRHARSRDKEQAVGSGRGKRLGIGILELPRIDNVELFVFGTTRVIKTAPFMGGFVSLRVGRRHSEPSKDPHGGESPRGRLEVGVAPGVHSQTAQRKG
jgi:hypothetical protein